MRGSGSRSPSPSRPRPSPKNRRRFSENKTQAEGSSPSPSSSPSSSPAPSPAAAETVRKSTVTRRKGKKGDDEKAKQEAKQLLPSEETDHDRHKQEGATACVSATPKSDDIDITFPVLGLLFLADGTTAAQHACE